MVAADTTKVGCYRTLINVVGDSLGAVTLKNHVIDQEVRKINQRLQKDKNLSKADYHAVCCLVLNSIREAVQSIQKPENIISTSLMFFNRNVKDSPVDYRYVPIPYRNKKIKGVLTIDAFSTNKAWDIPYISIPFFEGEEQIVGAPRSLVLRKHQCIANTIACDDATITPELNNYFQQHSEHMKTFISIPLWKSNIHDDYLGVLNINATNPNSFYNDVESIVKIASVWCETLLLLLTTSRPQDMSDNEFEKPQLDDRNVLLDAVENFWAVKVVLGDQFVTQEQQSTGMDIPNEQFIQHLFNKTHIKFYDLLDEKKCFPYKIETNSGDVLEELSAFEALSKFYILGLEEAVEKGYLEY